MKALSVAVLAVAALSLALPAQAGCGGCSSMRSTAAAAAAPPIPGVGQLAPDFELPSTAGHSISLAQYLGKRVVVLYFYPKDETPGCTKEACDFRDHSAQLEQAGVVILGVSNDDLTSHADFRQKEHIPFPLLSDTDARVSKMYGVYGARSANGRSWTGISRTTFVIDKDGRIVQVWPNVNVDGHVDEVLTFVSKNRPDGT